MQQKDNVLAVITNSGSTNTPASTLTVYQYGSAVLAYQKGKSAARFASYHNQTFPAGTFASNKLAALLGKIKDVSTIPDHGCLKSVSFGSTTTVTFQGKTSGAGHHGSTRRCSANEQRSGIVTHCSIRRNSARTPDIRTSSVAREL